MMILRLGISKFILTEVQTFYNDYHLPEVQTFYNDFHRSFLPEMLHFAMMLIKLGTSKSFLPELHNFTVLLPVLKFMDKHSVQMLKVLIA